MDTTDGFKGFKKLHYFPNVALDVFKVYDAPAGWHWGSKAEPGSGDHGGGKKVRQPEKDYYSGTRAGEMSSPGAEWTG